MEWLEADFQGKRIWVLAQKIGSDLWFHLNGRTYVYSEKALSRGAGRPGHSESIKSGEIKAPMPGKVTKILARPGVRVNENDPVVVMEAMKMEYTLKAEIQGKLMKLSCKEGDQVELGQLLAAIEEDKAGDA